MPGGAEQALEAVIVSARDHRVLSTVGTIVANVLKRRLSHPGSGAANRRGGQRSSPGEPPAVDTGRLRASIDYAVGADSTGGFVAVGTSVQYAPYLEYGTSRMAARPFFRPAVEEVRPKIETLLAEQIVIAQRTALSGLPREIIIE